MKDNEIQSRIDWLLDEILPLANHSDLLIEPHAYLPDIDTLHIAVIPRSPARWAETAYSFGNNGELKYDRSCRIYGIDGQPRVDYSGLVWVRYKGNFLDDSRVVINIWSQQPSHCMAERQLVKYYGIWKERHEMESFDVFRKFSQYSD